MSADAYNRTPEMITQNQFAGFFGQSVPELPNSERLAATDALESSMALTSEQRDLYIELGHVDDDRAACKLNHALRYAQISDYSRPVTSASADLDGRVMDDYFAEYVHLTRQRMHLVRALRKARRNRVTR